MAPPKGKSNNPRGRPPKSRALTEILERAGSKTLEVDGKKISSKQLVARLAWELVTTGQVALPEPDAPRTLVADMDDWLAAVKWIYAQVDGPPKQELEHSGPGGAPVTIRVVHDD